MEQTTLFDVIERKDQHRRHHNRVYRKRGDYTAYHHFLIQYKLNLINGKRVSIFKLQSQFNITEMENKINTFKTLLTTKTTSL